jgi:hypothetical protein
MGLSFRPYVKGYKRKEKHTMKTQRNRQPFKATDNKVYETLASVILGYPINTKTRQDENNTPKEIKNLLKNL